MLKGIHIERFEYQCPNCDAVHSRELAWFRPRDPIPQPCRRCKATLLVTPIKSGDPQADNDAERKPLFFVTHKEAAGNVSLLNKDTGTFGKPKPATLVTTDWYPNE